MPICVAAESHPEPGVENRSRKTMLNFMYRSWSGWSGKNCPSAEEAETAALIEMIESLQRRKSWREVRAMLASSRQNRSVGDH
jgi:hypothetical protein